MIFGDPWYAEALSIANIIFFGFMALYSVRLARRAAGWMRFLTILIAIIGAYWSLLYVYVLLTPSSTPLIDPVIFGQMFVRPPFALTGATMAAIAIYRWRSGYKP